MPLRDIFTQTVDALWENKLRSFLTMAGIAWGIVSVIVLVGFGTGFDRAQRARLKGLGSDIAVVWGGKTTIPFEGYAAGRNVDLIAADADLIQKRAILIKGVSPEIELAANEVTPFGVANSTVHGVWPQYQEFRNIDVSRGRNMTRSDEHQGARVAVLGSKVKDLLFPSSSGIGETVAINGSQYVVVGILSAKLQQVSYGDFDENLIFVPFSAMERDFPPSTQQSNDSDSSDAAKGVGRGWVSDLVVQVVSASQHETAMREIYHILGEVHHFDPGDQEALFVWDTLEGAKQMTRTFRAMTLFFGVVAVLTLVLSGIGLMNIMLVAVAERTREIGLSKALGARPRDIQYQFVMESAIITLLSGVTGLLFGIGACLISARLPLPGFLPHPILSYESIAASLLTLAGIALFAGTLPARRARNLSPAECLRAD